MIGGNGLNFSTPPLEIALAGAQAYLVPSGQYNLQLGRYTSLEWYDSNVNLWRGVQPNNGSMLFQSDGTNWRLFNRTGTPVGAIITTLGTGYNSVPAATISGTGGSQWQVIVGGGINTTVTVTTAGLYNYVPTLVFSPPPDGGVTATGVAVLSAGAITSVTVSNRGAGYKTAPTITIIPDPRETAAGGGVLTVNATLSTSTIPTAVICTDPGTTALTALPTLTFSGGGGTGLAATVIMNWTVTGFTVGTAGVAYGTSVPFQVTGVGLLNQSTDASGDVNPLLNLGLTKPRNFLIAGTSTSGGAVTATGALIDDAGWGIQRVPDAVITAGGGALPTTAGAVTITVGAMTDVSYLQKVNL